VRYSLAYVRAPHLAVATLHSLQEALKIAGGRYKARGLQFHSRAEMYDRSDSRKRCVGVTKLTDGMCSREKIQKAGLIIE